MINRYLKAIAINLIKFYQYTISYAFPPNSCRFYPSCSNYAIDAVAKYGLFKGSGKAIYRILRCNPWNKGGMDPA
ncbi:MAG: membrane protein insertion efficiency factor YidD [candidate division Zixibacteria bacterium]|nr:membrane protein insertion efficiency factor YidD [candidate division Zixibacteria bacterium]